MIRSDVDENIRTDGATYGSIGRFGYAAISKIGVWFELSIFRKRRTPVRVHVYDHVIVGDLGNIFFKIYVPWNQFHVSIYPERIRLIAALQFLTMKRVSKVCIHAPIHNCIGSNVILELSTSSNNRWLQILNNINQTPECHARCAYRLIGSSRNLDPPFE